MKPKHKKQPVIQPNKAKFAFLIPILLFLGLLTTLELIHIYYVANFDPNAAPSFCAISEKIDCDAVARTSFSLFLGVPNAIWGFLFYIFIFVLYYAPKLKKHPLLKFLEVFKNPTSYIFCLSFLSFFISLYLAWVSSNVIHKICILCYVTYVINFLILLVSKGTTSIIDHIITSLNDLISAFSKKIYAISAVLLTIVGVSVLFTVNMFNVFEAPKSTLLNDLTQFQNNKFSISGNILGDENPKVIINEYTDIQCPYCAMSNAMLHKLVKDVKGVQVVHHDFPLDKACNPIMKQDMHINSCLYSQYALAAKKQGKFWGLTTLMFDNNKDLTEEKVLKYAKKLKLNVKQLKKDAYSDEIKNELKLNIENNIKMGINSTPTYFINGKKYEGIMPYEELTSIVEKNGATLKNEK